MSDFLGYYSFLVFLFRVCLCNSGVIEGPCRRWYRSCDHHQDIEDSWVCSSIEEYIRYTIRGCPVYTLDDPTTPPPTGTPPPPVGRCQLVNDVCQFNASSTLQCSFRQSVARSCQYECVEENGSGDTEDNCTSSTSPPPDALCVPMNGRCQVYSPCQYWKGFCSAPYRCGDLGDYYRFRFGPQPSCAQPPPWFVKPTPPGECILMNGSCSWSNCYSHLDNCRSEWMCGTAYDAAVYFSKPHPPCPNPPPGTLPPDLPGECVFNLTSAMCQFAAPANNNAGGIARCVHGGSGCSRPEFQCVADYSDPSSPHTVCTRRCSYNNGGCAREQMCVDRPFCVNCSTNEDNIMEGTCLNAASVQCPAGVRMKCAEGTNYCVQDKASGSLSCVGSCLRHNGGCGPSEVCLSQSSSTCHPSSPHNCLVTNKCIPISDVSEGACPVGQERSGRCSLGCEDYQSDTPTPTSGATPTPSSGATPTPSSEGCGGCSCPAGLVRYRDRCVDPRDCYALYVDPPPFNPLPLSEDQVLLLLTTPTSRGVFVSEQRRFIASVQTYLNTSDHSDITVSLHGYTGPHPLQVAILLSGGGEDRATSLAELIQSGVGSLSLVITGVSVMDAPRLDSSEGPDYNLLLVVVCVSSALLALLAVSVVCCYILRVKKKKNRRPRMTKTRTCNEVTVIQSDDVPVTGDNGFKYSELYGSENFSWESLDEEEKEMDDKKLPEDKKSPE